MAEADLDALARDLDAAAALYPPLDCQAGLWQRVWPGEADALEPGKILRWSPLRSV
jgi:hypothetical protein